MTPDERPNRPSRQSSGGDSDEISNERSGEQSYESSDVDQTDTSSSVEIITDNIRNTTLNGTATGRPKLRPKSLNARARSNDYRHHMSFLSGSTPGQNIQNTQHEEIRTTPLFSGGVLSTYGPVLPQYGLLAQRLDVQQSIEDSHLNLIQLQDPIPGIASSGDDPRLFLNTNTPWSTFICGSQGSGKSHTLSVMLENALLPSSLGKLPNPLAGIVFHYDRFTSYASNQICESAYLCSSNIPVKVLVSPTNYWRMKSAYENLPGLPANARKPEVIPLRFKEKQLDASRMMSLMSVSDKDGPMPLYIEVTIACLISIFLLMGIRPYLESYVKWLLRVKAHQEFDMRLSSKDLAWRASRLLRTGLSNYVSISLIALWICHHTPRVLYHLRNHNSRIPKMGGRQSEFGMQPGQRTCAGKLKKKLEYGISSLVL